MILESPQNHISIKSSSQKEKTMFTCSYCCEEFLFEFKLEEHVKNHHQAADQWPALMFQCLHCRAEFLSIKLLNKHISFAHDMESDNQQKENIDGPDLTFLNINTTPIRTPKSILKQSGKTVLSPTSAALRRTVNSHKHSASARRELRFDLPAHRPKAATPELFTLDIQSRPQQKKLWNIFAKEKPINSKIKRKIRTKSCKLSSRSVNQIITSTPVAFSEDNESDCDDFDHSIQSNWSSALKTSDFKPLSLIADRFQCNVCQEKFDCNAELLNHKSMSHRKVSFLPPFKCGKCASTFYRNRQLLRHHHQQC